MPSEPRETESYQRASDQLLRFCLALAIVCVLGRTYYEWAGASGLHRSLLLASLVSLGLSLGVLLLRPAFALVIQPIVDHPRVGAVLVPISAMALLLVFVPELRHVPAILMSLGIWVIWRRRLYPSTASGVTLAWATALLAGVLLRLAFVATVPQPTWSWDTPTYLNGVHSWLGGGDLGFDPSRPPVFTLYVLALLSAGKSYLVYLLATHALGLGAAWWAARRIRSARGEFAGWLVLVALGLNPKVIWFEHRLLSESTFVFSMIVVAVLGLELLQDNHSSRTGSGGLVRTGVWGAAAAAAILSRPVAMVLAPLMLLVVVVRRWSPVRVGVLLLALVVPLAGWATYNSTVHGFFGLTNLGPPSWFGVSAHLLDLDSPGHERIKAEMRPALEAHNRDYPFWDPHFNQLVWTADSPLKTSPTYAALPSRQQDEVLRALSQQAIRQHPFKFLGRVVYQAAAYQLSCTGFYMPHWERLQEDDLTRSELPPEAMHLVETTGARLLAEVPERRLLYELLVVTPAWLLALIPLHVFEQPVLLLFVLCCAHRDPRDRLALIALGLFALALIGATALLGVGWIARYQLQALPLIAASFAVVAGRWAAVACSLRPEQAACSGEEEA